MKRLLQSFAYQYHWRNLFARKAGTALNLFAIFVTVLVFLVMNGMSVGLRHSLQSTGRDNVIVALSKGAESAEVSKLPNDYLAILRYYPEIAKRADGSPQLSPEGYMVKPLSPLSGESKRWIPIRAVDPKNLDLYQDLLAVQGETLARDGDILVGNLVRLKMGDLKLGDQIQLGRQIHRVVGFFSAQGSAFESEIWITRNDFKVDFSVDYDSIATIRFDRLEDRDRFLARAAGDQRLRVDLKTERQYFAAMAKSASILQLISTIIAVILSVAAVFTGMNALYASIASRTKEIGTLRAMGFGRRAILYGFLFEGITVALIAGLLAVLASIPFQHLPIAYMRSSFRIIVGWDLKLQGMLVCLAVGWVGAYIPARQAAKMKIVRALR